jgi:hypothetical protein
MYVCIHGERRWIIAPAWLTPQLRKIDAPVSNYSTLDAFGDEVTGDLISYPFFDVTMGPGDILFLPPACWHQVASIPDKDSGLSSALNFVVEIENQELEKKFAAVESQFNAGILEIENIYKHKKNPTDTKLAKWIASRNILANVSPEG